MRRIAYISADPGIPIFGAKGASIHVQEMLRAFIGSRASITVFSPRLEEAAPPEFAAIGRVPLPLPEGDPEARSRAAFAANEATAEALSAEGPFDLIYERHALFAHGAQEHARRLDIPSVLEVNAPLLEEQARYRVLALPAEAHSSTRRAFASSTIVAAVSPQVARYAMTMGAEADRVHVIPNAVNPARFPQQPSPEGPFTIGFLGTLKPWHDVATLVDAFAILRGGADPDARLLIVGDGPERPAVEARLASLGLDHAAKFTGSVAAGRVPFELARMHVGVAPYAGDQPFYFSPLKLYEYMAAGLPVIASDVGNLREVLEEGRTGLLCPPADSEALAVALARLASAPELRRRLGTAARAEVLARHTWNKVAARILQLSGLNDLRPWKQAS